MNIEITYSPLEIDILRIYEGLVVFNKPFFPDLNEKNIAIFIRDDEGVITGGVTGLTLCSCLQVKLLYLPESIRGKGYGSKLLGAVEAEARKNGLKNVFVDTYTFQAPGFYEKYGYLETGRYKNYPLNGVDKIFYAKELFAA